MGIYTKAKALRKAGKAPVVELSPALRIPEKQKGKPGRPRKYPPGTDRGSRYAGRRGKDIPLCLAKGCHKNLRIHQLAACSEVCESRIINDAIYRLKLCGVSAEELLRLYAAS